MLQLTSSTGNKVEANTRRRNRQARRRCNGDVEDGDSDSEAAAGAAASGDGGNGGNGGNSGNSGNSGDNGGGAAAVRLIMKGRRAG